MAIVPRSNELLPILTAMLHLTDELNAVTASLLLTAARPTNSKRGMGDMRHSSRWIFSSGGIDSLSDPLGLVLCPFRASPIEGCVRGKTGKSRWIQKVAVT